MREFRWVEAATPYDSQSVLVSLPTDYEFPQPARVLGVGGYSVVFAARAPDGAPVAIKRSAHSSCKMHSLRIQREIALLRAIGGRAGCLRVTDAWSDSGAVYMVTPQCDVDLHRLVRVEAQLQQLSEKHLQCFAKQLLSTLTFLHASGVVHRDVKPANIMSSAQCELVLADFNLARTLPTGSAAPLSPLGSFESVATAPQHSSMTDGMITRYYRAPEVLLGLPYGAGVDVWAAGCTLAELATASTLWKGSDDLHQLALIVGTLGPVFDLPQSVCSVRRRVAACTARAEPLKVRLARAPAGLVQLLVLMLDVDPARRITAAEALRHPWVQSSAFEGEQTDAPDPQLARAFLRHLTRWIEDHPHYIW